MFRSEWTREDQEVFERLANKFSVDLNDPEAAGENATFAGIESAARRMGQAVMRHLMADLALRQTELLDQPQPCPTCGKLCDVEVRQRPLTTADVQVELSETACHCSACRRDFFPSAGSLGAASARL